MAVGLLNDSRSAARKKASRMLLQFAELLDETDRINAALHERRLHPDYEYRTTDGPRKAWTGEPDLTPEGWTKIAWERFDYHEEILWARRKATQPPEGE